MTPKGVQLEYTKSIQMGAPPKERILNIGRRKYNLKNQIKVKLLITKTNSFMTNYLAI
jgi:hypothetical protein